jgi:hypothetical protein
VTKEAGVNDKTDTKSRKLIRGKGWKKSKTIASDKYEVVARAIVKSLTKTPITFSDLVKRVEAKIAPFNGSIPWYTVSCLRELEAQGKVVKHQKPVLYSKR